MSEEILTTEQVAKVLGCNRHYVRALREAGLLKMMKLGSWKCRRSTLDEFIRWADGRDFSDLKNVVELPFKELNADIPTAI